MAVDDAIHGGKPQSASREFTHGIKPFEGSEDPLVGRRDHGQRLWTLICFEIWWRLFVDRTLHPGDAI